MAKILLVSSTGGHFSELMQLKSLAKNHNLVICTEDKIQNDIVDYYVKYGSREEGIKYLGKLIKNGIQSWKIIRKENPDILISTGAHTCVSFFIVAKLFKIKTIYIESYAKVNSSSLTFRLIKPFVDVVIVQHKQMKKVYKNALYLGGLF